MTLWVGTILLLIFSVAPLAATNITVSASMNPVIKVSFDDYRKREKQQSPMPCLESSVFAHTVEEAVLNFRLPIPGMQQDNVAAITPDLTLAPDGTYKCTSDDCKNCIATMRDFFRARKYRGETDSQLLRRHALSLRRYCNHKFTFTGPKEPPRRRPPPMATTVPARRIRPARIPVRRTQSIQPSISTIPFPITETIIIDQRFWARRSKRQIRQSDVVRKLTLDCYDRGTEISGDRGYAGLCNWCWVLYQLTDKYSPRYVNDIECGQGTKTFDSKCLKGVGVCRATDKMVKHNRRNREGRLETYERGVSVNCECRFDTSRSDTCATLP